MSFIVDYAKDWALDKASGYLKTGIQTGGTLAGNAVGGVGSTIENGGRSFGEGSKFYEFISLLSLPDLCIGIGTDHD